MTRLPLKLEIAEILIHHLANSFTIYKYRASYRGKKI
jgi:hypothetical protein